MKQTFLTELGSLADLCGEDLTARRTMVERWADDFGREGDDVICAAFVLLRDPERVRKGARFPGYYDVRDAIKSSRVAVARARNQPRVAADQGATLSQGVLMACVEYSRVNREHLGQSQIEDDLTTFLGAHLTALEIGERTTRSPGGVARAQAEEREALRKAAVAARLREIDNNTALAGE